MASDKNKSHNYKQNRYTEGYVPGGERIVKEIAPDIVNSYPIIYNQIIRAKGVNQVQKIALLNTNTDGDLASNDTFWRQPLAGSHVFIHVNGLIVTPANGASEVATSGCYFTDPFNTIVRTQGTFQVGDKLHWNGTVAGIELTDDDHADIIYQIQVNTPDGINQIQKVTVLATVNDGDLVTNDTFQSQPMTGTNVFIDLNGVIVSPANGQTEVATSACYFTDAAGTTVRQQGTFQVGDKLHWNGAVAGIQLNTTDTVNIMYQV